MSENTISLTIEGEPGQEVQVWYKGDREADVDDPAPIVFTGKIGPDRRVTTTVPRAHLMVGVPTRANGTLYKLNEEDGDSKTVKL